MKKAIYIIGGLLSFFFLQAKAFNKQYVFNNMFSISVNELLELRQDQDAYTRYIKDTLNYTASSEIVFQQKYLSNISQDAQTRYCRIMIKTFNDESCPYPASDDGDFSSDDIHELVNACVNELGPGQQFVDLPSSSIESTHKGHKYLLIKYTRSGYSGNVFVQICYFFNYKNAVKAIFSYRISESSIWANPIDDAIKSFSWSHPFKSSTYNAEDNIGDNSNTISYSLLILGIIVGICLMTIIITAYSKYKSYTLKHKKSAIDAEINTIKVLINEKKLTSATEKIISIRASNKDQFPEYEEQLNDCDKEIKVSIEEIKKDVTSILDEVKQNIIDNNQSNNTDKAIDKIYADEEIPSQPKKILKEGIKAIEEEYIKGIIPEQSEFYTQYEIQSCNHDSYCFYICPHKNTILFPYRRHKVELRGYTEENFENKLKNSFAQFKNYKIFGDVSILPSEGMHPYEPDISIIELNNKYGIRIDIEIDEPYGGWDKSPIHYIGCGDEFRDRNLSNLGWIVIRFSEKQVYKEASKCINYIKYILSLIDSDFKSTFINDFPTPEKRWSEVEARMMAVRKFREQLLKHDFGKKDVEELIPITSQTDFEKYSAERVEPIMIPTTKCKNIDNSSKSFLQDDNLSFEPHEHVYLYGGHTQLRAVSNIIDDFFEPFDSLGLSERVAIRDGLEQCEVLEDWDCKGLESREIGTFLHAQIEAYLTGKDIITSTKFIYCGEYININKDVSIQTELTYFKSFLKENMLTPFRSEWHICDTNLGIAGTIDLLSRNGSDYDIYDWKRSRKASPDETIWRFGKNGLEHIPDINFYHYALQQNLYRYILEKNYGINVSNMYIVVFHSQFDNYLKYQIPKMDMEIQVIVSKIRNS